MALPELAVRRPVTILMGTIALAVFGFLSIAGFPVELLPDVAYPTLTIQTSYPDAAPDSVEQFITKPVEEAVGVIPGVRDLRSTSRAGISEVVLEFDWGEEMDFASLDVREKLGLVQLPLEADVPRVLRFDPSLDPIIRLSLASDRPLDDLRQLAERWIKPRFEALRGVAAAKVRGGLDPEVHVDVDIDRLGALGLSIGDVATALQAENVNRPGGTVQDWGALYLVRTLHEFDDLDQIRRTIVRETPEGRVRVEDIARVVRGHRDRDIITRTGDREGIELSLHREGSANTMNVAALIRGEVAELRRELPDDIELSLLDDQSFYIGEAVGQVLSAALWGGLLAVLVLYFFLRDLGATVIIAISIPTSVVASFLPLSEAGVSLNIMSLGGLALGVGMLVDNSIVVLEAIDRHRKLGLSRAQAAANGAGEVTGAVTAATLTTICVFLPIVFVAGVAGQLFHDLALTVCLSLAASLLVSLTLIPTLSAFEPKNVWTSGRETLFPWDAGSAVQDRLPFTANFGLFTLPPVGNGSHWVSRVLTVLLLPARLAFALVLVGVLALWRVVSSAFVIVTWPIAQLFEGLDRIYAPSLRRALRGRWLVLLVTIALFAGALFVGRGLGTNLVPDLAQGEFAFQFRLPEETTLQSTSEVVGNIERRLTGDPSFDRIFSVVGSLPSTASGRQSLGENLAQINFVLPHGAESGAEARAVERVREVLALFPRVESELVHPSVLSMQAPIEVKVFAEELDALEEASRIVMALVRESGGVRDVTTTVEPGSPEVRVVPDRDRCGALGVPADTLSQALASQIRGQLIGEFREREELLDIRLRASEGDRDRAAAVRDLDIRLPDGTSVPVSALADISIERGPAAIYRAGGARVARVTADADARELGRVIAEVQSRLASIVLPEGAVAEIGGQNDELERSMSSLLLALGLAVFLVFVVMSMQFESLVHPFVILLAVPLGAIGVVGALVVTGQGVSVLALIGAVMLAGIVVNNAIVLVDAINRRRRRGEPLDQAIVDSGAERLRPILMTTATTVLALVPMALGLGAGDELRRPMAITVIGGLSVATVLTLLVIPCMYRVMARAKGRLRPVDGGPPLGRDRAADPGEQLEVLAEAVAGGRDAS